LDFLFIPFDVDGCKFSTFCNEEDSLLTKSLVFATKLSAKFPFSSLNKYSIKSK
jgi:hypothetical protein